MFSEFESVRNYDEVAAFRQVIDSVQDYPQFSGDTEGLADVACLALNGFRRVTFAIKST